METSRSDTGRRSRRIVLAVACFVAVAALGALYWYETQGPEPAHAARAARQPVPVSVAITSRQNVPIYLTGLGTVQAFFTVAIHSQVDGKLRDVFFKEGQRVKKGDVLAKIDPRLYRAALDQAKAKKAQDEAQLTAALKDLERFRSLVQKHFETEQNVDQQQAKVDQIKAAIDADAAAIETAQTQLDYTDIVAPNDGRMGVRMVDPGNILHANDQTAIAILTQTQPSAVLFTLPAQTLDSVRDAMARGVVEVAAYDRDNARLLSTGTLSMVDNQIEQATATYRLKAIFNNEDEKIVAGRVRQCPAASRNSQRCHRRPTLCGSTRAARAICLGGKTEQHGRAASNSNQHDDGRYHHRHIGSQRRRARGYGWSIQAADQRARHRHPAANRRDARGRNVSISEPFIRRPIATTLLMAALAFVGIVSFPSLPVAPLPQVDFPTIQITSTWAGASAETMATSVAAPLEQQFGQIAGIAQMTSQSTQGASTIVIQFNLERNINSAAQDVQAAITVATKTLPQALTTPPSYKKVNPADAPILLLSVHSDTMPLIDVDEYANVFLAQQISQVSGVAQVSVFGDRTPSIRVQVDPAKLAATGLTLEEIRGNSGQFDNQRGQGRNQYR